MSLPPQEQLKKFLDISTDILILIPENPSADAVGASWALYHFLKKKEKDAITFLQNSAFFPDHPKLSARSPAPGILSFLLMSAKIR